MDTSTGAADATEATGRSRRRWIRSVAIALGVVVAGAVGVLSWAYFGRSDFHAGERSPVPSFPSLADAPDPSLRGTMAYFDDESRCVRIVAAAGSPSEDVLCLTADDLALSPSEGKPAGPQLVWRSDGRLEVTLFRWIPSKETDAPPPMTAQWQKVVDVTTGERELVADAELPDAPLEVSPPTVNDRGERVSTDFDALTGQGRITLTTASGTRTLLSVEGPGEYTYGLEPAFWAPGDDWIVTTDTGEGGRILVITPTDPPSTRVLVTNSGGGAGGGTAGPSFAITGQDLLAAVPDAPS